MSDMGGGNNSSETAPRGARESIAKQSSRPAGPPEFFVAAEFKSPDESICVRVTGRKGYRNAYSWELVRPKKDPKTGAATTARFFQVFVQPTMGRVSITNHFDVTAFARCVMLAECFITEESQKREDEITEDLMTKERAQADRGKVAPKGLKSLSRADAAARGLTPRQGGKAGA